MVKTPNRSGPEGTSLRVLYATSRDRTVNCTTGFVPLTLPDYPPGLPVILFCCISKFEHGAIRGFLPCNCPHPTSLFANLAIRYLILNVETLLASTYPPPIPR
jgi:hypothetical protein